MLDLNYVRENIDKVREALKARRADSTALDDFTRADEERRRVIAESDQLNAQRNASSREIGGLMKEGKKEEAEARRADVAGLKDRISELDELRARAEARMQELLSTLPNIPHATVPVGDDESANQEVRRWGTPPKFDFEPKDHVDLGTALGILDLERATKITSARFAILNGAGARLERALINFMLDLHTTEHGYREMEPPFMVNSASLVGTGNLPKFEADLFKIAGDWDLFLIPTAEVPLTNLHRAEILDGRVLPIKYTAYTPCFRSEAGSYGQDVRGLIRQHQFDKVELVKFTTPEQSHAELDTLVSNAEEVLKRLELPFRTVLLCTGDMGFASAKTYDIEVWLPSQKTYREISSCSNTEAFQARRANIKFRAAGTGRAEFAHTLNGSGLAVGRTLIAILENYQERDGSVVVPEALRPYMGGLEVITK
jgi:seryl-tRNA synthetase